MNSNTSLTPKSLTPQEVVEALDRHIVGQIKAKKAVAIALRNRWRRMQLDEKIRKEITPKNILMIGPTGVGKTEIARRLAELTHAPFLKVEATKFTELGYVGRDVESIIRDLCDQAASNLKIAQIKNAEAEAKDNAIERVLDILLPAAEKEETTEETLDTSNTRKKFKKMLLSGKLDEREIEIEVANTKTGFQVAVPPGMEEFASQLQNMFQNMHNNGKRKRRLKINEALKVITSEEASKLVDEDSIQRGVVDSVEQNGIVFLDEIDKITRRGDENRAGNDVSREGVQRDLLPLIEGCAVSTKYGVIKTDHILFIASGAFHLAKPSDLIPELQGRLPIRVELNSLNVEDFLRILVEPDNALTKQYQALLSTEGVELKFAKDGLEKMAEVAWKINEDTENIGARRLHTVLENLLDSISFSAPDNAGAKVEIDANYVSEQLKEYLTDPDLARYIL